MQMYELLTPLRQGSGEPIPVGTTVPLPWDDGEALVRLGAAIRVEAETALPAATDADREARREELLRQLADVAGLHDSLQVAVVPSDAGMYLLTVTDEGVSGLQSYDPAADPLTSDDPAVIRQHHLDALRALDDLTYLAFDDEAAAALGRLVLLTPDADTGVVIAVTGRADSLPGVTITDEPLAGTGDAIRLEGTTEGNGEQVAPVAVVPADDAALAKMTKGQLLDEAKRVSATYNADMTKPELVDAIRAKRVAE